MKVGASSGTQDLVSGIGLGSTIPAIIVGVSDPGGVFGGLTDLQAILEAWAAGTLAGYLRSSGGEVHVIDPSHPTLTGTSTWDLQNGNVHPGTLTGDVTITTVGWPASGSRGVMQWSITGDGTSTPTFSGVTWIGDAPGIIGAGDVLHGLAFSDDGGTVIWGAVAGDAASSALLAALVARTVGYTPHGSMGATETFDAAVGSHSGTFTADCAFTLTAVATGISSLWIRLVQDGTGGWTMTLPASVVNKAALEAAQVTTAGTTSFLVLISDDAGTAWYGGWWGGSGSAGTPATTVTDETTFGIAPAVGTGTDYARDDHTHGSPANPVSEVAIRDIGRWEYVFMDGDIVLDGDDGLMMWVGG